MTGVTHISVGAAVGKFIPNPLLALIAGIISHIVIDKVPHSWPQTTKYQRGMMIGESVVGILLIFALCFWTGVNKWSIVAGAIGGASVDLFLVVIPFLFIKKWRDHPIRVWHENRQIHKHNEWYWLTDIAMISIALGVLFA